MDLGVVDVLRGKVNAVLPEVDVFLGEVDIFRALVGVVLGDMDVFLEVREVLG